MIFHASDVKMYLRCPRYYRLRKELPPEPYQPYVRLDEEVSELILKKFGVQEYFLGKQGDDPQCALNALEQYDWLVKARFEAGDLRVKVPFLQRKEQGWHIYFLFVGLYPHADDPIPYQAMLWVLKENHIPIESMSIIHLNEHYIRGKVLDPERLFTVSDTFYNIRNHPSDPVGEFVLSDPIDFPAVLKEMKEAGVSQLPEARRNRFCTRRQKCRFYDSCFESEEKLPDNSILHLAGSQLRYQMKQQGIRYLKDADPEQIEGSGIQYAQILADRNGGLFADRLALKSWLSFFRYPISFLDFEWERYAIPPYEGMKPFDVLLFEYSLHVLREDGKLDHYSFLSTRDGRKAMVKSLLRHLPKTGSVVAYNAFGAETIRIAELAEQLPQYRKRLLAVNQRMIDMQVPFVNGMIYDTRMRGSWTLKCIMSMMEDGGYRDLEIRNGMDAVYQWRKLDRMEEFDEHDPAVEDLKAYCGMDTYSMTVVYKWLKQIVLP